MGKSLTAKLADARSRIKELETQKEIIRQDREKYRQEYIRLLKLALEVNAKGNSFDTSSFILTMSRLLTRVESWYWS